MTTMKRKRKPLRSRSAERWRTWSKSSMSPAKATAASRAGDASRSWWWRWWLEAKMTRGWLCGWAERSKPARPRPKAARPRRRRTAKATWAMARREGREKVASKEEKRKWRRRKRKMRWQQRKASGWVPWQAMDAERWELVAWGRRRRWDAWGRQAWSGTAPPQPAQRARRGRRRTWQSSRAALGVID